MVIRSPAKTGRSTELGNLMAFGFGFNKQKVLSAAEKCVQQGKLENAISEYQKVLKADPKDLTVMNTVGDLHARLGENDKAADCFKSVGDAYASQGFTVKAIAMYKKLSKLKSSMECVLRLAELYTQQGLFNDARAQYLLVAEDFLKSGQLEQAIKIFQKTLEMDPDNVPMRTKLAEVYVRLNKKDEAWKILSAAAESLRSRGQLAAADEILQRMLKLDPGNSYALVLRGKAAVEAGDFKAAIECLGKVPDLDTNPEGLRALFHAYLRSKRYPDALNLAGKMANVHDDLSAVGEYTDALIGAQQYRDVLPVFEEFADRLLRADHQKFLESVRSLIGYVKDDTQSLETLLQLFQKAGESTHLTEIYELLAHASVQSGDLEKARDYYLKLTQLEPGNQMHAQNYQQVLAKQGTSSGAHLISAEEGTALADELEATAPFIEQRYDDETALAVRAAMTDAELFISYNMPAKALGPLVSALPKAPRDLRLNQKLAALHTRAGRFAEAAVSLRTLETLYRDAGHNDDASRYADLASKYEERSGAASGAAKAQEVASVTPAVAEFEVAAAMPEPGPEVAAEVTAQETPKTIATPSGLFFHGAAPVAPAVSQTEAPETATAPESSGTDLSSEWEQDFAVEVEPATAEENAPREEVAAASAVDHAEQLSAPEAEVREPEPEKAEASAPAGPNLDEAIEEVRFYLGQGMTQQADDLLAKLEALAPGAAELAVLRLGVDSAKQIAQPEAEVEVAVDEPAAVEEAPIVAEPSRQPWPSERPVLQQMVSEIEDSLGDGFLAESPAVEEEPEGQPAEVAQEDVAPAAQFRAGTLDEFVSDLEASLGNDFAIETPAQVEAPAPAPLPAAAAASAPAPVARAAAAATSISAPAIPTGPPPSVAPQKDDRQIEPSAAVDLSDMFGDLKSELESDTNRTDEDPETHYNLGVAFREMGLLDEAIGEFQKVCQATENGHSFNQVMQTYTWLAQCFLDKGVPEAAVRWYEKALKLPSLDQETRTALHYELASSFESAGNRPAALTNFLEVYGANIDYRDVAERIKALRT
jgi:pilus assembly protein FimV